MSLTDRKRKVERFIGRIEAQVNIFNFRFCFILLSATALWQAMIHMHAKCKKAILKQQKQKQTPLAC